MKKLILLAVYTLAISCSLSASNQDSVTLSLRRKAYSRYHAVKDTVTVRTWMNMDRMNKALIQVVEYDNQLLDSYKSKDTLAATFIPEKADTLLKKPIITAMPSIQKSWFDMRYFMAASILIGLLVLVLIVMLVVRTISLKRLRQEYNDRDETFDAKLNRLDYLENEVVKMKTRENDIKAELEKGIVDYQDKMQTLRKRIDELANENTRLENLNLALSDGKSLEGGGLLTEKNEEMKQEIIVELEGMLKRVKKTRK